MILFTEELRKCLNAAGLSDCGENDSWNYWYQRVLKAHNDAVERQIATEQSENAKLRELVRDMHKALFSLNLDHCQACPRDDACVFVHKSFDCDECAFERDMRELRIEVDE